MLENGGVSTRLPAQDLDRARAFYADKLGLEPVEERPGGLLYRCARGEFALFQSDGAPSGSHTQMAWEVESLVEAGLEPWEAVAAATWHGGQLLEEPEAGVIRESGPRKSE